MRSLPALAAAIAASVAIAAPAQAAGGLFGLLFGNPTPPPPSYYAPQPFEMTVKSHKRKSAVSVRKPKEGEEKSHAHLQQPLDPAGDREWFLKDPTLRRGDIIVLSDRVVVYTGGHSQPRMADFANLYATSLVSKKDQEKIRGITQAPAEALVRYQTLPAPSSTAAAAVEQAGFKANPVASTEALRP